MNMKLWWQMIFFPFLFYLRVSHQLVKSQHFTRLPVPLSAVTYKSSTNGMWHVLADNWDRKREINTEKRTWLALCLYSMKNSYTWAHRWGWKLMCCRCVAFAKCTAKFSHFRKVNPLNWLNILNHFSLWHTQEKPTAWDEISTICCTG